MGARYFLYAGYDADNLAESLETIDDLRDGDATVDEVIDGLSDKHAYVVFSGEDYSWTPKPETEQAVVDASGVDQLHQYLERKDAAGTMSNPIRRASRKIVDGIKQVGYKSTAIDDVVRSYLERDEEYSHPEERNHGPLLQVGGASVYFADVTGEYVGAVPDVDAIDGLGAPIFLSGLVLEGRGEAQLDAELDQYLDSISEQAGDYHVHPQ